MKQKSAQDLANWLLQNQPEVFVHLAKAAGVPVKTSAKLGDFMDILSSIGTGISSAAKSVGSFLTSQEGTSLVGTLGTTYLASQAQQNALKLQVTQAQNARPLAPLATQLNPNTGAYEVVYTTQNGQQVPVNASQIQTMYAQQPSYYGAAQRPTYTINAAGQRVLTSPATAGVSLNMSNLVSQPWFPFAVGGVAGLFLWLIFRNNSTK